MMNSPVSYMGNNPIRDQLREWTVRGRYLKELEEKEKERLEWEEEEKRLEEEYGYGPFPLEQRHEGPIEFDESGEEFDF